MPTFEYTARDADGAEHTGVMQADSETAVVRTLADRALFPVQVGAHQAEAGGVGRGRRIKVRHLAVIYSQLSDLLRAGVPMLRSLDILVRTAVTPRLAQLLAEIREDVAGGEALAEAMSKHPAVFSDLHVAMVRAGEHAGFLEDVLANTANFLERQDDLRSKVRGAMIYPVVLAVFGTIAVTAILLFLVPQFKEFLSDVDKPLPTRILFTASDALRSHGLLLAGVLVAAVLAVRAYVRSQTGRRLWAGLQLKIPLAGKAVRMVAITRFCRVLGTMLANGVPIIQALVISKDAAGNQLMVGAIERAAENVRAGEPLAEPLARSGMFPEEIVEMIAVGEESNQLEKVLVATADAVERRTNRQVDAAVRLIEPLLLVFMAGAIGFIAAGLLYPIFTAAQSLK